MKFLRGDVVVRSVPYSWVVDELSFKEICSGCLRKTKLMVCSKCKHLYYCSQDCQKSDWAEHRSECGVFEKFPQDFIPNSYTRLLARTLRKHASNPHISEEILGVDRTVDSLVSHEEAKQDTEVMTFFGERYVELRSYYKLPEISADQVMTMFLKLWVNCQSIGGDTPLGLGLYLGQSAIDHSCVHDKRYGDFYDGTTFVIKALEDADLELDDIRIHYRNLLQPRDFRRKELSRWYFTCNCPMCSGEVEEIITNDDPNKLNEVSDRIQNNKQSDPVTVLKSYINSDLKGLTDYVQLECAWSLAFQFLPADGKYVEAVPYLKAILALVLEVYGRDEFYLRILRRVKGVCQNSLEALQMMQTELDEIETLEIFYKL